MRALFLNTIVITGRLGADPKLYIFESGDKKITGRIAHPDSYYSKKLDAWVDQTLWIDFEAMHPKVVKAMSYLQKSDLVTLQGKLKVDKYTRPDGTELRRSYIFVENFAVGKFIYKEANEDKPADPKPPQDDLVEELKAQPANDEVVEDMPGDEEVPF